MSNKTFIILSGIPSRFEHSNQDFWIGYINIQRTLNTRDDIVFLGHTWNDNNKNLIESAYGSVDTDFKPFNLTQKMISAIDSLRRKNHIFPEIPAFFYMYQSRTNALKLLEKYCVKDEDRLIITRYDIGYRLITPEVSTIIIDDDLPRNLIYSAYYFGIDEGYGDQWTVFDKTSINYFLALEDEIMDILKNDEYFYDFNYNWPLSKKPYVLFQKLSHLYRSIIKKIYFSLKTKNKRLSKLDKILYEIINYLMLNLDVVIKSGEIYSYLSSKKTSSYHKVNPINTHALFKYSIFQNGLRDKIRFLDYRDLRFTSEYVLINQIGFVFLIIFDGNSPDNIKHSIYSIKKYTRKLKYNICIAVDSALAEGLNFFGWGDNLEFAFYDKERKWVEILSHLGKTYKFLYFYDVLNQFNDQIDEVYLNSLINFLNFSQEFLIELTESVDLDFKEKIGFPDLIVGEINRPYFHTPSLIKIREFKSYIESLGEDHPKRLNKYERIKRRVIQVRGSSNLKKS